MTALPEEERTYFECPECQNYFDAPQFTPTEIEEGPWCPLCGIRLERIPVDVLSGKPDTEGVLGGDVAIDYWHSSTTWD
jgi:hypothetical protein